MFHEFEMAATGSFGDIAIMGYGRFGRALGELIAEAGVRYRAYDALPCVPRGNLCRLP